MSEFKGRTSSLKNISISGICQIVLKILYAENDYLQMTYFCKQQSYQVFSQIKMEAEKSIFDDAKFEAMLDELRLRDPEMLCKSGNKISKVCLNPNCKIALQCGQYFCNYCGCNVHQTCPSFPLEAFTHTLNSRTGSYKDLISKVVDIDNQLISAIQESKKQLTASYQVNSLPPNIQQMVDQIYKKKSLESISGQEGKHMFEKMQQIRLSSKDRVSNLLTDYRGEVEKLIRIVTDLKKQIFVDFALQDNVLSSVILKSENQQSKSQIEYLRQALNNPKSMKLLYRGSQNDFRAEAFHQKCGDVENTLTLVRTEFGKTIAAFTPYKWHSVPNNQHLSNPAGGSFILSLDLKEKLIPIETTHLILNSSVWGPRFGNGNDMGICEQCNINSNSFAGVIQYYNTADRKYQRNQSAYTAISGTTGGCYFKVTEYEVFQVVR